MKTRYFRLRHRTGSALVITLSLLVLLSVFALGVMSMVRYEKQSSVVDVSRSQAEILARSMGNVVIDDFLTEIVAGSANGGSTNGSTKTFAYRPLAATNMLPQRVLVTPDMLNVTNFDRLYKQSAPTNFYGVQGAFRASSVSTAEPARNGRFLSTNRWSAPMFVPGGFASNAQLPYWIYVTRGGTNILGQNVVTNSLNPIGSTVTSSMTNSAGDGYVIGRVAYNVYELGGTLDVNVAGKPTTATVTKQETLSSLTSIHFDPLPDLYKVAEWVNAGVGTDMTNYRPYVTTNALRMGFLTIPDPRDHRFVSRQDLIAYAKADRGGIPTNALPNVTHYSRGLDRASMPASTNSAVLTGYPARPANINPYPTSATYLTPKGLVDGSTRQKGDPVATRRFPLRALSMLTEKATSEEDDVNDPIFRAFGLVRSTPGGPWTYVHGRSKNKILTLAEVAELNREPDFFETLQAAINAGSLGGSTAADGFGMYHITQDQNVYRHILQIGANIIDQYDNDDGHDYPTQIQFENAPGKIMSIYGVENLPYINEIPIFYYRPAINRNLAQGWLQFEVWNPHQPPSTLHDYKMRIAIREGKVKLLIRNPSYSTGPYDGSDYPKDGTKTFSVDPSNTAKSPSDWLDFSLTPAYLEFRNNAVLQEPKILGNGLVNSYNVDSGGTTTPGSVVNDSIAEQKNTAGDKVMITAANVRFAGIKMGEVSAPDDYIDGKADGMSFGVPAPYVYNSFAFSFNVPMAIEMQIYDDENKVWRTTQRLETFKGSPSNPRGANQWLSGSKPRNSTPDLWSGWLRLGVAQDPRHSRFAWYNADSPGPGSSIRSNPASYSTPGGGTFGTPANGWFQGTRLPTGLLEANIPNNPYATAATGYIYYADPDGVIRRGDAEERPTVPTAFQTFPLVPASNTANGDFRDRPRILNRPFDSVAELGYVFRDVPWKTLDFSTKDSGDIGILDYFTLEEAPLNANREPLKAGVINPNTASYDLLKGIIESAMQSEYTGDIMTVPVARSIAAKLKEELAVRPIASIGELARAMDDDVNGVGKAANVWRKSEKEAVIRALGPVSEPNVWNFMIDIIAQVGRFPPGTTQLKDFAVQGEAHYWMFVAIDRTRARVIDIQLEPVVDE